MVHCAACKWPLYLLVAMVMIGAANCDVLQKKFTDSTFEAHRIDSLGRRDFPETLTLPNWLSLVPGVGTYGILPPYIASAPGSGYVARYMNCIREYGVNAESASDVAFSTWHELIGHCDLGTVPCTKPGLDRVLGCCPAGQLCAYRGGNSNVFMGCVDDIKQECYNQRCNPGYVCCPAERGLDSRCVPDLGSIEDSCGRSKLKRSLHYSGRSGAELERRTGLTRKHRVFPIPKPSAYNGTITLFRGTNTSVDFTLEIFRCKVSKDWCKFIDDCLPVDQLIVNTTVLMNGTVINTPGGTRSVPAVCCPNTWTPCFSPTTSDTVPTVGSLSNAARPIGCADTSNGEVCCGKAICPSTGKCCVAPGRSTPGSAGVRKVGLGREETECCSLSDQCCFSEERGLYCGKSVNGVDCASDARGPPMWYIQDGPLDGAILP